MKQMYSQAEMKRKRDGIFSSHTVRSALNNGAVKCGHADALKGFRCIPLIWCHCDDSTCCVIMNRGL